MGIVDAQSVPNASSGENKGYDAGKKISGIKRHIVVDTNGLPHGIHLTSANVTDRDGAVALSEKYKQHLAQMEKMLVDGGYRGEKFAIQIREILNTEVEVVKRTELHTFKVLPKSWVVERSFSWLEKCRRLWRNCERLFASSEAFVKLVFIRVLVKRF